MENLLKKKYAELIQKYRFEKEMDSEDINRIIAESIRKFINGSEKTAIYCNGGHTKILMADFVYELKSVKYIVDNYAKTCSEESGYCIISDGEIEENGIDSVIISSFKYRDEIVEQLRTKHSNVKYLNIYDEFEKNGIRLQADYYYYCHPFHYYHSINVLQRKIKKCELEEKQELYFELIEKYVQIKDFKSAITKVLQINGEGIIIGNSSLADDLRQIYELEKQMISNISENNVLMFCLDGLRRGDLCSQYMPELSEYMKEETFSFSKAYSYSTSTFESLVPVYSETTDFDSDYFLNNYVEGKKCRFLQEAKKQNRKVYFYTDADKIIKDNEIIYSGRFQTITQKIWSFILDATNESNGLFYIHELYESHFTFSNPYTEEKLISEGTAMLFDFLPVKGGKLRANYKKQHEDSLRYLDDVIAPFMRLIKFRFIMYADHGNLILEDNSKLENIKEMNLICSEDWIRIPLIIKSPEMGIGTSNGLISHMEFNDMMISLLQKKKYEIKIVEYIKVARSELYNPDFKLLYKKLGKERDLLAFEAFIYGQDYKLVVFANGDVELYDINDNLVIDERIKSKLFNKISCKITVV